MKVCKECGRKKKNDEFEKYSYICKDCEEQLKERELGENEMSIDEEERLGYDDIIEHLND